MINQPSTSAQARDSHPVRQETRRRSSYRSESSRRGSQQTHQPRTYRDDRRTSIRSTKRSSTTNLANQPPQGIPRMDASIRHEPDLDFTKSLPAQSTYRQSRYKSRETFSRQTLRTPTPAPTSSKQKTTHSPGSENDEFPLGNYGYVDTHEDERTETRTQLPRSRSQPA